MATRTSKKKPASKVKVFSRSGAGNNSFRKLVIFVGLIVAGLGFAIVGINGAFSRNAQNYSDAAACVVDAKLVNSCRPWFGIWSNNHGVTGFRAQMEEHENRLGRKADIVHWYHSPTGTSITNDEKYFISRPNTLLLANWKPSATWGPAGGGNASVNASIDAMADSIRALGDKKIFLTIYHEPENDVSTGTTCPLSGSGNAGSPAEYRAMWQNTRKRFDAKGVKNVVWVFNYMGFSRYDCMIKDLWPGNQYVDWVLWDPYAGGNETWDAVTGRFYNVLTAQSNPNQDFLSKPWGLGEFGSWHQEQAKTYKMYSDMTSALATNKYPKIKMYVDWDAIGIRDSRVDYAGTSGVKDPTELAKFKEFANSPYLMGGWSFGSAPTPPPPPPAPTPTPTPVKDTTPPTITVTGPANNSTVSGKVTFNATAKDNVGVTAVTLRVDEVWSSTDGSAPYSLVLDTTKYKDGNHVVILRAWDKAENRTDATAITLNIKNTVTAPAPTPPTKPTTTTITAGTTSNSPKPIRVSGVVTINPSVAGNAIEIWVDGKLLPNNSFDASVLTNGNHTIRIVEKGVTSVQTVAVNNPLPLAAANNVRANLWAYSAGTGVLIAGLALWFGRTFLTGFGSRAEARVTASQRRYK